MNQKRGFTLLMAVLVASVMLALGYALYNIAVKEVLLSSSGRESQFAFYAADTGVECALYYDSKFDAFSTSSALTEISCGVATSTLTRTNNVTNYVTTFTFAQRSTTPSPCMSVIVTRDASPKKTTIESSGYNTCDTENPFRIERAIRVTY